MNRIKIVFIFCFITVSVFSQSTIDSFLKPSDTLNRSRRNAVIITEASLGAIALIGLDQLWYKDFPRSNFHTLNDNNEWLQMDKFGHVFTSYQLGKAGADILKWSGVREKDQLIYGATLGFTFLTAVEVFDGFSEEWGFSWGDILANASGSGLYIGQQLLWKEQRIVLKYSFHQTQFANQNPSKLGEGFLEEVLKDYNGQTYWLSANLHSFFNDSKIPKWLNVAIGFGAEGMLTGNNNSSTIFVNQNRTRQFYLSLDIDLTKIKTNSRALKTLFSVVNVLKIPAPTLEFNNEKEVVFHLFYY